MDVGQTAVVVGRNQRRDYWIVQIPGETRLCWLWDQYAVVSGDTRAVPFMTAPPAPPPAQEPPPQPVRPSDTPYP
jgi:hypothetical protein